MSDARGMMEPAVQRLDKWLWFARIVKTRPLAARLITAGKVRINRERTLKPGRTVHAGDVITAAVHGRIRVLKVLGVGVRRGPAPEARTLYEDMSPPPMARPDDAARFDGAVRLEMPAARGKGAGRPTKRDRRRIDAWRETGRSGDD